MSLVTIRRDPDGLEVLALHAVLPDLVGRRVLEVGCGDGRLTRRYAHRAGSVHAIDPDPSRVAALEADRPEGNVTAGAAGFLDDDLHLPEPAFDAIILSWSL
jgi:16S rRNA A1518/A1519 N6-dimethyltransferase RsmA/KsgA/DIM1 with predicted DNA glycosylase/AP lyase activity